MRAIASRISRRVSAERRPCWECVTRSSKRVKRSSNRCNSTKTRSARASQRCSRTARRRSKPRPVTRCIVPAKPGCSILLPRTATIPAFRVWSQRFSARTRLPPEFEIEREDGFVDYLIDQVIPLAAAHGAVYADAFCEPGFFSPEQTRRYLESARQAGMRLRVHCDEMAYGAAAAMAVQLGVDAVDHCNYIRRRRRARDRRIRHRHRRLPVRRSSSSASKSGRRCARCSTPARALRLRATTIPEPRRASIYRRSHILAVSSSGFRRPKRSTRSPAPPRIRCAPRPGCCAPALVRISSPCSSIRPTSSAGSSAAISPPPWSRTEGLSSVHARRAVRCARALAGGETRRDYAFIVREGSIVAAGNFTDVRDRARELDARAFPQDRLVVPGFINGHSHAYQILLRGWADDLPFATWRSDALYRVVPRLTPGDVYWTFVAAFSEMLAAGITTVAEFFYLNGAGNAHAEAAIRAARDHRHPLDLRAHLDGRGVRAGPHSGKASSFAEARTLS